CITDEIVKPLSFGSLFHRIKQGWGILSTRDSAVKYNEISLPYTQLSYK
ncbi:hypothetical protein Bhyg_10461, partial [Pseudolycoriella hygida]